VTTFLRHLRPPSGTLALRVVDASIVGLYAQPVRFLLANNHCISDPTAGVTQSLRTIMQWLADAGHGCHILTTARFESPVTFTIEEHLKQHGVDPPPAVPKSRMTRRGDRKKRRAAGRPVVHYTVGGVPVTLLLTRHNDELRPDRAEAMQFQALLQQLLEEFAPDQLIACNAHPMIQSALGRLGNAASLRRLRFEASATMRRDTSSTWITRSRVASF
jgi:hypothetical protein